MSLLDQLLPIASFALVASFTPGPNNMLLTAAGANFGVARTLPHIAGTMFGFCALIALCGLGVGELLQRFPELHDLLRIAGALFLLYLAYRVATAGESKAATRGRPITFVEAALFQFINPKAWTMGLSAVVTFIPDPTKSAEALAMIIATFLVIGTCATLCWTLFGQGIGRFLKNARHRRAFNWTMAGLLAASIGLILL